MSHAFSFCLKSSYTAGQNVFLVDEANVSDTQSTFQLLDGIKT